MYWFFIFGIGAFIVITLVGIRKKEIFRGILVGTLVGIISAILLGGLTGAILGNFLYDNIPYATTEYELVAIENNSQITGSFSGIFFIASGKIENGFYYTYYYKDEYGIRFGKQRVDNYNGKYVVVKEEERTDAKLIIYEKKERWSNWALLKSGFPEIRYEFIVPRGTVQRNFNLDLEK